MTNKKLENKKPLNPQTMEEELANIDNEIFAFQQQQAKNLEEINEYYKTHDGGGMFYRWHDDETYFTMKYFKEQKRKIYQKYGKPLPKDLEDNNPLPKNLEQ